MAKFFVSFLLVGFVGCSSSGFRASGGGAQQTSPSPSPIPEQPFQSRNEDVSPVIQESNQPSGLVTAQGVTVVQPNYQSCAALPEAGKVGYPARCAANSVMSVINDGTAKEMTCCPLHGTNILSANASEQYLERSGKCQADEVGVGMVSPQDSRIYCTKINTQFLRLGPPETAIYASSSSGLNPTMQVIAESYNVKDCCICPERKILIGGHTTRDNSCQDQCVEILLK